MRIVKLMYFDEPAEPFERKVGVELRPIIVVTSLFTLLFFAWPGPILDGAAAAAAALFAG
jgi:NADH-quinone oxidoreductase subunit N